METERIYYKDAYQRNCKAKVISVNGDKVILDRTIFYPGGGGQKFDIGMINEFNVVEAYKENNQIVHVVEPMSKAQGPETKSLGNHNLKENDKVFCEIDWSRRYELMKSHTAEHIMFRSLWRIDNNLKVTKIRLDPEKKRFYVAGKMDWDMLEKAQITANEAVMHNYPTSQEYMKIDDAKNQKKIRVTYDGEPDESVRIMKIGDFDAAACTGTHVRRTSEVGAIAVTGLRKADNDEHEIEFKISTDAVEWFAKSTKTLQNVVELTGADINKLTKTVSNLVENNRKMKKQLRSSVIDEIEPETKNGIRVYKNIFEDAEKKNIISKADELIKNKKTIVIFANKSEKGLILLAKSEDIKFNAKEILEKTLEKSGGKENFAMGGCKPEEIEYILNKIEKDL